MAWQKTDLFPLYQPILTLNHDIFRVGKYRFTYYLRQSKTIFYSVEIQYFAKKDLHFESKKSLTELDNFWKNSHFPAKSVLTVTFDSNQKKLLYFKQAI